MSGRKNKGKVLGIIVSALLVLLIFSVLIPPGLSVKLHPGTLSTSDQTPELGHNITFTDVNLTIENNEAIPVNYLNFTIKDEDDNYIEHFKFYICGTEFEDPSEKFKILDTTYETGIPYENSFGYGYDYNTGTGYDFGYGYGYGLSGGILTILYDIEYDTDNLDRGETYYAILYVHSDDGTNPSHTFSSDTDDHDSSTFTVESGGSRRRGGGGGGISNNPPTANAGGPYSAITGEPVEFEGSGEDTDGEITGYRWDFTNDGIWDTDWSTSATATHTYNPILDQDYTVKLQVKDNQGATGSDTASVSISIEPVEPPLDTDGDGLSDDVDTDDDNDGLDDETETEIGSDPKDETDVLTITIGEDDYYLVDTDGDGIYDKVYNPQTEQSASVTIDGEKINIDTTGDGKPDYTYDLPTGQVAQYEEEEEKPTGFPIWIAVLAIVIAIILIVIALFKMGYLYVEEPGKKE